MFRSSARVHQTMSCVIGSPFIARASHALGDSSRDDVIANQPQRIHSDGCAACWALRPRGDALRATANALASFLGRTRRACARACAVVGGGRGGRVGLGFRRTGGSEGKRETPRRGFLLRLSGIQLTFCCLCCSAEIGDARSRVSRRRRVSGDDAEEFLLTRSRVHDGAPLRACPREYAHDVDELVV